MAVFLLGLYSRLPFCSKSISSYCLWERERRKDKSIRNEKCLLFIFIALRPGLYCPEQLIKKRKKGFPPKLKAKTAYSIKPEKSWFSWLSDWSFPGLVLDAFGLVRWQSSLTGSDGANTSCIGYSCIMPAYECNYVRWSMERRSFKEDGRKRSQWTRIKRQVQVIRNPYSTFDWSSLSRKKENKSELGTLSTSLQSLPVSNPGKQANEIVSPR